MITRVILVNVMKTKRIYNFILAIITILNGYAFSFFRGFSLAMIIVSAYALFSLIIVVKQKENVSSPFIIFALFSVILSILAIVISNEIDFKGVLYASIKLIVWALFISLSSRLFFDFHLFFKYLKYVVLVTFAYLVFQYVAHYLFHLSLPCTFDFGVIKANYDVYIREYSSTNAVFRPGSLWTEPGYLGYVYNGFLTIVLFSDCSLFPSKKQKRFYLIISMIGVVMSMSTGAIGIMLILVLYRFLTIKQGGTAKRFLSVLIVAILVYCSIHFNWISILSGISEPLDKSIYKLQHLESVGRVGQSYRLISLLPPLSKVFGVGVGNEDILFNGEFNYMNGYTTVFIWSGVVGVIAWILTLSNLMVKKCKHLHQKVLIFMIGIIGLFSGLFFGAHSFLYFIVAIAEGTEKSVLSKRGQKDGGQL